MTYNNYFSKADNKKRINITGIIKNSKRLYSTPTIINYGLLANIAAGGSRGKVEALPGVDKNQLRP